ncbi:uncharacterized protein MKZ38_007668 [Zalerion maritima]|uniref:Uncharacterized protein n=1 Tax=Zalerion maritima TaxID=339359 RepID=A0AAD5RZT4_9PEZI|nr:uncharacterized protein MKZ38_007668 [Zalerion maritima]
MSHQRYPSEAAKEPHSISLKVLRLSCPSLVTQHVYASPLVSNLSITTTIHPSHPAQIAKANPASLAYSSDLGDETNPAPFVLSPILNLPPSFGAAYVGETFSCTLCANHEVMGLIEGSGKRKEVMDVRIEAEMKTPGSLSASSSASAAAGAAKIQLVGKDGPQAQHQDVGSSSGVTAGVTAEALAPGKTIQRNLFFELKEEGNHVLAVTVSYYEKTETSGRTRTFRKLYQFMCKGSVVVRTKCSMMPTYFPPRASTSSAAPFSPSPAPIPQDEEKVEGGRDKLKWVLEAQLENCSEEVMQLDRVMLDLAPGLKSRNCNWDRDKPVLHPLEVEQVAFVVEEEYEGRAQVMSDGRVTFGVLGIGWRNEMGNRGFLNTGKLVARVK